MPDCATLQRTVQLYNKLYNSTGPTARPLGNGLKGFKGLLPESQGQNLALTVLYVPYSLDKRTLKCG